MDSWIETTVGDVLTLQRGFDITRDQQRPGTVPVVSSGGIASFHDTIMVHGPGVVIGRKGTLGTVFFLDLPYWPHDTTLWVKDFKGNCPRFVYYFMRHLDVTFLDVGSANPTLNRNHVHPLRISWPPVAEQRAIAEVLGALDDKIAANTRAEELSERLIGALYLHAVGAEGHKTAPLFEVFDVDFGEAFKGEHFTAPGVGRPLIRIRDLKTFSSQIWTTEARARESVVQPGEVVVGMDAEFRPTWWLGEEGLLNQRVCRIRGRHTGAAFAREALRQPLSDIEGYKTGTTVIHLNKRDLEQVRVAVPSRIAKDTFEAAAEPLLESRVSLAAERKTLADMRDAVLPQLMSGRIRVHDAEQLVGDVV
jgi:type I restriction enzyme S subunit